MSQKAYSVAEQGPFDVAALIQDARDAERDGLASYWVGQQFDWDAFVLLGVLAREVPRIELGTATTHIWTAFPVHLAQQAASVNLLASGRFTLGLGLNHDWVMRDMWGLPFERPVDVLEEYLAIVMSLLRAGRVDFDGAHYRVHTFFSRFSAAPEFPVLLGALGPRMLRLAGSVADGTMTWMAGPRTLRSHVVPRVRDAAAAAGRKAPRVVALVPTVVTDDPEGARRRVTESFALYQQMPSYQAMLRHEGAEAAGGIAIVGTSNEVVEAVLALRDVGVTDYGAILVGDDREIDQTREHLTTLVSLAAS